MPDAVFAICRAGVVSIAFVLSLFLSGLDASAQDSPELERYEAAQRHMGVLFKIVAYAPDQKTATQGIEAAFARIKQLNQTMSDFDPTSELSRLGRSAPHDCPVKVSPDLWNVLHQANEMSQLSEGAFDVTIGPLTRLWRRARKRKVMPTEEALAAAKKLTSYRYILFHEDDRSVQLTQKKMRLDLGGIAKGYAADQALLELGKFGIHSALVDASGDVTFGDAPPNSKGWKVGVAPLDPKKKPSRMLRLSNCSVATSGDAWQFVEIEGKRYSHIVDPKTGFGLNFRSSVTVIARRGTTADALASTVSVLGAKAGLKLAESIEGVEALVVYQEDGEVRQIETSHFPKTDSACQ